MSCTDRHQPVGTQRLLRHINSHRPKPKSFVENWNIRWWPNPAAVLSLRYSRSLVKPGWFLIDKSISNTNGSCNWQLDSFECVFRFVTCSHLTCFPFDWERLHLNLQPENSPDINLNGGRNQGVAQMAMNATTNGSEHPPFTANGRTDEWKIQRVCLTLSPVPFTGVVIDGYSSVYLVVNCFMFLLGGRNSHKDRPNPKNWRHQH